MYFNRKIKSRADRIQIRAALITEFVNIKIKTMIKKNSEVMSAVILILISIVLSSCTSNPAPETANTSVANQSQANLNNDIIQSQATLNNNINQSPTVLNNNGAVAVSPSNSTPVVGNTPPPTGTADKNRKSLPSATTAPTAQIGGGGSDMLLFTQARGALSSDKELSNSVIIELKDGNATLTGNVSSQEQKIKAGQLVQGVNGIKSVKNNLRVAS